MLVRVAHRLSSSPTVHVTYLCDTQYLRLRVAVIACCFWELVSQQIDPYSVAIIPVGDAGD